MPRRLPEKIRHVRPRHFKKREKKYNAIGFQRAPVTEGQELNVVIDDIGSRGDGISRVRNFLIFVPQTKVGERLKVKILRVGRKFAIAEKIKEKREEGIEN